MQATDIDISYHKKLMSNYFNFVTVESSDVFHKSSFIESIILGLPLGSFIIDFNGKDSDKIADGNSRIYSVKSFVNNKFKLKNLEILTILNGCKFSDLDGNLQRIITEVQIDIIQLNFMNSLLKTEILNKLDK